MPMQILSSRDRLTPLRLLGLMPDWGDETVFQQIWGQQMGSHFWRKFTRERDRNINSFILELDTGPEQQLWQFLMRQSATSQADRDPPTPRNFMIFYRRNHTGMPFHFISVPYIAITHHYICNLSAHTPEDAMYEMHPDTWDDTHDSRVGYSFTVNPCPIQQGDVIIEYTLDGLLTGWMAAKNEDNRRYLEELPPW